MCLQVCMCECVCAPICGYVCVCVCLMRRAAQQYLALLRQNSFRTELRLTFTKDQTSSKDREKEDMLTFDALYQSACFMRCFCFSQRSPLKTFCSRNTFNEAYHSLKKFRSPTSFNTSFLKEHLA